MLKTLLSRATLLSKATLLSTALLLLLISVAHAQTKPSPTTPNFEVQRIANDVYAVIRKEPPSLWFNPNTVFIIGKQDVIVVDANISSEYTKEVLAALRKITLRSSLHSRP